MHIAELILEYVRVLLSWPVVLGLLGLYFLKNFKDPVADMIRRFTKAAGYGVSLEAANPQQIQENQGKPIERPVEDKLQKYVSENPAAVITEFIKTFNAYWFERSFNLIFGTQIALLEYLLEKRLEGEAYINLEHFHRESVQRSGGIQTIQFAHYLGFLQGARFVRYEGDPIRVYITDYGVDFISYLRTQYAATYRLKTW